MEHSNTYDIQTESIQLYRYSYSHNVLIQWTISTGVQSFLGGTRIHTWNNYKSTQIRPDNIYVADVGTYIMFLVEAFYMEGDPVYGERTSLLSILHFLHEMQS